MATILIIAHTKRGTGFGRIAIGIANALSLKHDVHVIGVGNARTDEAWAGLISDPVDIGCTTAMREWLTANTADVLLFAGVNTLMAWQAEKVRSDGFSGKIVAYVPVEGPIENATRLQGLNSCDAVIAYHSVAAAQLSLVLETNNISFIYHGMHATSSAPIARDQLRRQLLPDAQQHAGKIWILNANRNDNRKCPEITISAFAEVVKEFPNTLLVMHCNPIRPGVNLYVERDRLGLHNNILFTKDSIPGFWTDEQMDNLYACCEIGVNSALAEGWGLIAFEHAQKGGAQIMPAHEGLKELWANIPVMTGLGEIEAVDAVSSGHRPCQKELTAAMRDLLMDTNYLDEVAQLCMQHVRQNKFSWENVSKQWQDLIIALTANTPAHIQSL